MSSHQHSFHRSLSSFVTISIIVKNIFIYFIIVIAESELMSLLVTPRTTDPHVKANDSFIDSPEQRIKDFPKRASVAAVDTQQERPEVPVSQPSAFTSNTFTPASTSFPTTTELTSTTGSSSAKRNTKTSNRNSTSLYESPRTKHRILSTSQSTKTTPARNTAGPPKAPVTDTTPLGCNITDRMLIKTGWNIKAIIKKLFDVLLYWLLHIENAYLLKMFDNFVKG